MDLSRRRLFTASLATVATAASGADALAKTAHAKHAISQHTKSHLVHGHGHIAQAHHGKSHLAKAQCTHGKHGHTTLAKGVSRRELARPYIARDLATGEPGCAIRKVHLYNLHTDEQLETVFFENGHYDPAALAQVNRVLRDFRTGELHTIDPDLLNLLDTLRAKTGTRGPFHVISGYRSPTTNAMLQEEHEHSGVATHSLHMQGEAIDIRLEDVMLPDLRKAAYALQRGGVGYYPASNFVHVDVGDVRHWGFVA